MLPVRHVFTGDRTAHGVVSIAICRLVNVHLVVRPFRAENGVVAAR
jgi:hypothetical protein